MSHFTLSNNVAYAGIPKAVKVALFLNMSDYQEVGRLLEQHVRFFKRKVDKTEQGSGRNKGMVRLVREIPRNVGEVGDNTVLGITL